MKISNKIKSLAMAAFVTVAGVASVMVAPSALAGCPDTGYKEVNGACVPIINEEQDDNLWGTASTIINWILGIVGFLAVVMIIVGGINYTLSAGDANNVKKAKDTILYGIIGLVIALLAAAIVNFVLGGVFGTE